MDTVKRILIPLDGSPLSETILPVAEAWGRMEDTDLVLLRAALPDRPPPGGGTGAACEGDEAAYLGEIADRLERHGVRRVRSVVWFDTPARAIVEAVSHEGADLIAMATHGRSGLRRVLLGSVAEAVVSSARVPVVLIRGQSAWKPWATGRILVPLDGSEVSEGIIPVAQRLAGPRNLTVLLLRVIEPWARPASSEALTPLDRAMAVRRTDAEQYLGKIVEMLEDSGLRVERAVRVGPVADTIAAVAIEAGANLIVMATHGRRGLGRFVFGGVEAEVLRRASVPVLFCAPRLAPDPCSGIAEVGFPCSDERQPRCPTTVAR